MAAAREVISEGSARLREAPGVFYNRDGVLQRDLTVLALRVCAAESRRRGEPPPAVLDAMSGSGVRALRYALEVAHVGTVVANDASEHAVRCIRENAELSGCAGLRVECTDASELMGASANAFGAVCLDPFGSCAHLLPAAVRCLASGGILCASCTDMETLSGLHEEACAQRYGIEPLPHAPCAQELALRTLLANVAAAAGAVGRKVTPLLSVAVDFYVRVIVRLDDVEDADGCARCAGCAHGTSAYPEGAGRNWAGAVDAGDACTGAADTGGRWHAKGGDGTLGYAWTLAMSTLGLQTQGADGTLGMRSFYPAPILVRICAGCGTFAIQLLEDVKAAASELQSSRQLQALLSCLRDEILKSAQSSSEAKGGQSEARELASVGQSEASEEILLFYHLPSMVRLLSTGRSIFAAAAANLAEGGKYAGATEQVTREKTATVDSAAAAAAAEKPAEARERGALVDGAASKACPQIRQVARTLARRGFACRRSHCCALSLKTDAPALDLWAILAEWVSKSPLPVASAGAFAAPGFAATGDDNSAFGSDAALCVWERALARSREMEAETTAVSVGQRAEGRTSGGPPTKRARGAAEAGNLPATAPLANTNRVWLCPGQGGVTNGVCAADCWYPLAAECSVGESGRGSELQIRTAGESGRGDEESGRTMGESGRVRGESGHAEAGAETLGAAAAERSVGETKNEEAETVGECGKAVVGAAGLPGAETHAKRISGGMDAGDHVAETVGAAGLPGAEAETVGEIGSAEAGAETASVERQTWHVANRGPGRNGPGAELASHTFRTIAE
ncbi:N2,N2-dimethylguanosine tRNA methyltransferase-domain-containing protein, partial [Pavlovales sp. CCMP2436]